MTNMSNSGTPQGAGGKDTSHFNPDTGQALTEGEIGYIADHLGGTHDRSGEQQSLS